MPHGTDDHPLIFDLEVDVTDRDVRPWRIRTHYVRLAVPDRPGWSRVEQEARNLAAWMCWHVRGNMVTAVRITDVEA